MGQILALAVDTLTQNIFYMIRSDLTPLTLYLNNITQHGMNLIQHLKSSLEQTISRLKNQHLRLKRLQVDNIFVTSKGEFLIENDLLIKPKPYFCSNNKQNINDIRDGTTEITETEENDEENNLIQAANNIVSQISLNLD